MPLRIIFMGTPDFSVPVLKALHAAGHEIVAAYSQPPRPAGRRGLELTPSPVHRAAEELGIEVLTPLNFRDPAEVERFRAFHADVAVVVAYGLLLPPAILEGTRLGCYNGHASLLPRWRGAAPIQRAIMAGDRETGMMVMKMDAGLDTGPVLATRRTPITEEDTSETLTQRLCDLGAEALIDVLEHIAQGNPPPAVPQSSEGVLYAAKIQKQEALIDWSKSAADIAAQTRAFYPRVPAFTFHHGARLRLLKAKALPSTASAEPGRITRVSDHSFVVACGEGALEVSEVQLEGKNAVSFAALRNGHPDYIVQGQRLGEAPAPVAHGS